MTIDEKSTVSAVALQVGATLLRRGIRAVLTGGACVSLYTRGAYHSKDVDFVLPVSVRRGELDEAMAEAGFQREGDRYEHPRTALYVEFPPGPLAVGEDVSIRAVEVRRSGRRVLALSAIREWSVREGALARFEEFQAELKRARSRAAREEGGGT